MVRKILIADDEPDVLNMLAEIFRQHHFEVCTALNAKEFETIFFREIPDLIILDIFFGSDSGPEVYDRVMKMDDVSATPVIFLSGKMEGMIESPLVPGRQIAMYNKPIKVAELVQAIRTAFPSDIAA